MISRFEKVVELLKSQNHTLEVVGNTVYTLNCTIEVSKKEITVNEKPVQLDQVLAAVSEAEERHGKLINIKCHYDNGSTTLTRFNGTEQAANNYFVGTALFSILARKWMKKIFINASESNYNNTTPTGEGRGRD